MLKMRQTYFRALAKFHFEIGILWSGGNVQTSYPHFHILFVEMWVIRMPLCIAGSLKEKAIYIKIL